MWENYYDRVSVQFSGYGHYKVSTMYHGKKISFTTDNMPNIDIFKSKDPGWKTIATNFHKTCVLKNK